MDFKNIKNKHLGIDLLLDKDGELVQSSSGDLSITNDGRKCLLQDIKHIMETLPGDLFSHPEYGTGLKRLSGNEDEPDNYNLIQRTITDALLYNQSIISRIEPEKIKFSIKEILPFKIIIEFEIEGNKETVIL